jgi:hypothetical protein
MTNVNSMTRPLHEEPRDSGGHRLLVQATCFDARRIEHRRVDGGHASGEHGGYGGGTGRRAAVRLPGDEPTPSRMEHHNARHPALRPVPAAPAQDRLLATAAIAVLALKRALSP